jgi:hypothetical protein
MNGQSVALIVVFFFSDSVLSFLEQNFPFNLAASGARDRLLLLPFLSILLISQGSLQLLKYMNSD